MFFNNINAQKILTMVHINRIFAGSRVKGPHGPLVTNPNGGKRRVREKVYGTVIKAIGAHKWEVRFDFDGVIKEVTSKSLSLVEGEAGVPVDELRIRSEETRGQVRLCVCCCCSQFPSPALTPSFLLF